MDWQSGSTALDGMTLPPAQAEQIAQLLADLPQFRLEYELSTHRDWVRLTNPREVRDSLTATFEVLEDSLGAEIDFDIVNSIFERMSDEELSLAVAEESMVLHSLENILLEVGVKFEIQDLLS